MMMMQMDAQETKNFENELFGDDADMWGETNTEVPGP
jgi:hypothetical protein